MYETDKVKVMDVYYFYRPKNQKMIKGVLFNNGVVLRFQICT